MYNATHWELKDDEGMIDLASDVNRESVVHLAATEVYTALRSNVYALNVPQQLQGHPISCCAHVYTPASLCTSTTTALPTKTLAPVNKTSSHHR